MFLESDRYFIKQLYAVKTFLFQKNYYIRFMSAFLFLNFERVVEKRHIPFTFELQNFSICLWQRQLKLFNLCPEDTY